MANQDINLSLPEDDLREARILAARRGTSVSQLLARMLREAWSGRPVTTPPGNAVWPCCVTA